MQLTNKQFQNLVKRLDVSKCSPEVQQRAAEKAIRVLTGLHQIETIERIQNLAGAIGLLEDRMLEVLRLTKTRVPSYEVHPSQVEAFLESDDPFADEAKVPGQVTQDDLANLLG